MAAYRFAAVRCADRCMLDAGCGEGYGTALLARSASRAVGVDLVPDVVAHAARAYPHVGFIEAELGDVPYPDASFDVVVSFQVIEHLWNVSAYLAEMARLLAPGGMFLCPTVNRLTFTSGKDRPTNPFHVREFTAAELAGELSSMFEVHAGHRSAPWLASARGGAPRRAQHAGVAPRPAAHPDANPRDSTRSERRAR